MTIAFDKLGYDPFIDFLKAYSIICVVLGHALPSEMYEYTLFYIWGGMQVPMFVLIQAFHAYKKGVQPHLDIPKICKRIVYPFLLVQAFIVVVLIVSSSESVVSVIVGAILGGGKGPGAYYPWVYLQIAVILVVLWPVVRYYSIRQLLIPFIFVCVAFDVLFSLIGLPEFIYRLTAVRYIFLVLLGLVWIRDGIKLNTQDIFLSLLSIAVTIFFWYNTINLEPIVFTTGWKTHRWICYFYVSNILVVILYWLYRKCNRYNWLQLFYSEIARSSYEIFLIQMAVFVLLPPLVNHFIEDDKNKIIILFLSEIILSIWLGIEFRRKFVDKLLLKKK